MKDEIITPYPKDIPLLKKLGLTLFNVNMVWKHSSVL